jgi:hypothetical protein
MMNRTVISEKDLAARRTTLGLDHERQTPTADAYSDRLIKYIPPDVIAAFSAIEGIVAGSRSTNAVPLGWFVFAVIGIATPFYLVKVGGVRKPLQVVISTIAFVVWAFAYPGEPFRSLGVDSTFSSVVLALYTFLIPLFIA